jgi:hypothetical protein
MSTRVFLRPFTLVSLLGSDNLSMCKPVSKSSDPGRYQFIRRGGGSGRPRVDNDILYHILLPIACYIDRDNFETEAPAIVVTRSRDTGKRQSIDLLFQEGMNIEMVGGFIGPDEEEYDRLRDMYPKVYVAPGTKYPK